MGIRHVGRVVGDLDRAEAFYRDALGFRADRCAAETTHMRLGDEAIMLRRPTPIGRPYPPDSRSDDLWFQHLAIVVVDMDAAYGHLLRHAGWQPISHGGPQLLPPENGGVRAFKFRDPDGHPLELIWLPPGQGRPIWQARRSTTPFLGIDHSALAVSDMARSVAFYQDLGFTIAARALNHGPAQERLDAVPRARVAVTGLRLPGDGMGLELLAYDPPGRARTQGPDMASDDIASDATALAIAGRSGRVRDPDGHRLVLSHDDEL